MGARTRPLIGIVAHQFTLNEPEGPTPHHGVDSSYVKAVRKAGGLPVLLPLIEDTDAADLVGAVDGVLLTGGDDVEPARYGQPAQPGTVRTDPVRDGWDVAACLAALQTQRPLLAVCRGLQILNVALGGTLVQHIESHYDGPGHNRLVHEVSVEPASDLATWLGPDAPPGGHLGVNSLHHQAVDRPGQGLTVQSRAEDGVVEALALDGRPDVLGVQWHPELLRYRPEHLALFRHLVALAGA